VDGLDAYNRLATREFDAVVSDINMPNLDGLALTSKIRREPKYAELPIILVTALSSDEDKQRGLEAGANAYITKPAFDQKTLLDCLERMT
jgi:two-component system, chemotaxis family, sensor kinase CheA